MEHEEIYTLMMEALDGEIEDSGRRDLEGHLHDCTPCQREWRAIQTIHQLFLDTPILSPAADFAERTLRQIPVSPYRIWLVSGVYGLLLLSGLVPLIALIWLTVEFGPALNQPAFVRIITQVGSQVWGLGQVIAGAAWQAVGTTGELLGQQPNIIGWLLVMAGIVFLWGGVYSRMTSPRRI
jgi:anti-sigma factor RsiW